MTISTALRSILAMVALLAISACATLQSRQQIPPQLVAEATIHADQRLRYWGDDNEFARIQAQVAPGPDGDVDYLTLSGGGINGAYGAGFLVGWTDKGGRPEFEVVTGISVGAMIAPMAFLGSDYDARLRTVFSSLTQKDNSAGANFLGALFGAPSVMSNVPVLDAIRKLVDTQALNAIGVEHKQGRRLYVGTTNLNAQRPMIWDIGAIAISNLPNRLELVHQIILASTAVPGVFPPVMLDVAAQGMSYDELHVDGGVTEQVLLMPGGYEAFVKNRRGVQKLYVIFNGVVAPSPATVQISSMSLLERAVPTLLKYLGRSNLEQLDNAARKAGLAFGLTAIPADFPESTSVFGSPQWLSALYQYGYQAGRNGRWQAR
ncbi:patatin-like phospholipase family protein [Devosia sp. J2-20]|uniref:patatin-like phospholipase family protein n=1 Tax=Devosia sp. J2-20 TaxID=3026161 RepID=UPI00249A67C2|nr:patatin-like phospholipase family protein [Devosia sp. J2-20]WDQ98756.1 patatin-like phospholipase family protein [Devosia sp. J2-20]